MTTIGFIGAGNIGANVARAAANAGYDFGGIDDSWKFGFGQPAFIEHQNLTELEANIANATRGTQ
jgi:3-hydroxyisobutyrate dehydrogenase-like beta-hydroxyacid dehydrogenase